MKKILFLLILIYTSCDGPSSSSPDLSEAIIGNWWLHKECEIDFIGGSWDTVTTYYTLDTTNNIHAFKHDSIVDRYYRDYPNTGYDVLSCNYYVMGDTLVTVDTGPIIYYHASVKNGILSLEYEYYDYKFDRYYKEYSGPIPPEW